MSLEPVNQEKLATTVLSEEEKDVYAKMEEGRSASTMGSEIASAVSFVVKKPSLVVLFIVAAAYFISGICQAFSTKLQNRVESPPGPDREPTFFSNPFWQTMVMFLAEALCYPLYFLDEFARKRKQKKLGVFEFPNSSESLNKPPSHWAWWILPAACDLIGVAAANWALSLTYTSTVGVIRNSSVIWTAFGTLLILRKPLRVHQWIGTLLSTAGMVATGVWAILSPDESNNSGGDLAWVGILSALVSVWMGSLHMVLEEAFMKRGYMPPLKGVGIQGVAGIPMNIIAIIVTHYAGWFSITDSWYQFCRSGTLIGGNIWYFFVTAIANAAGLATTKLTSGLVRSVLFAMRSPTVWIIEMAVRWSDYTHANLVALILVICGFFTFILLLPYVSKERTPKLYRGLRKAVPCFCTKPLPDSDVEAETPSKVKESPSIANVETP